MSGMGYGSSRDKRHKNEYSYRGLNPGPRTRTVKPGPRHLRTVGGKGYIHIFLNAFYS